MLDERLSKLLDLYFLDNDDKNICDSSFYECEHVDVENGTCISCGQVTSLVDKVLVDDNFNINKSTRRNTNVDIKKKDAKSIESSRVKQRVKTTSEKKSKNFTLAVNRKPKSLSRKTVPKKKKDAIRDAAIVELCNLVDCDETISDDIGKSEIKTTATNIFRLVSFDSNNDDGIDGFATSVKKNKKRTSLRTRIVACVLKAYSFHGRISNYERLLDNSVASTIDLETLNDQLFRVSLSVCDEYFSTIPFVIDRVYVNVVLRDMNISTEKYSDAIVKLIECVRIWTDAFNTFQYRTVIASCVQLYDSFLVCSASDGNFNDGNCSDETNKLILQDVYMQKCQALSKRKPPVWMALIRNLLPIIFRSIVRRNTKYPVFVIENNIDQNYYPSLTSVPNLCYILNEDFHFQGMHSFDYWNNLNGKRLIYCDDNGNFVANILNVPIVYPNEIIGIAFDRNEFIKYEKCIRRAMDFFFFHI